MRDLGMAQREENQRIAGEGLGGFVTRYPRFDLTSPDRVRRAGAPHRIVGLQDQRAGWVQAIVLIQETA